MINKLTILCISSYEKGQDFMKECKAQGCRVILLTSKSLENAAWPRECIDEIFYIPDKNKDWNMRDVIYGVSYMARREKIDRIVALDDFDVERAASLREHLRIGGMGETTARYFRDKLAMRTRAAEAGIPVPEFLHILNHNSINDFANRVSFPYMVKARMLAGAYGIKKVHNRQELWDRINFLGDEQSFYLIERFIPGNIYHVDSIIYEKEIKFACASKYGTPPFEVAHEGRVFSSMTLDKDSEETKEVLKLNEKLLKALGLLRGVSHSEFIKDEEGKFYFLETSARVGGANLSVLVEAATGINLWREWAKIEIQKGEGEYKLPDEKNNYAAILTSLAKLEKPDLSSYTDSEIVWNLNKEYHAGLIFRSPDKERITHLLNKYTQRFYNDFFATAKMGEKPTN
jgi:hypothetical protein